MDESKDRTARPVLVPLENNFTHFEVDEEFKYKQEQLVQKKQQRYNNAAQENTRKEQREMANIERAQRSLNYLLKKSLNYSQFFKNKLKEHIVPDGDAKKMHGGLPKSKTGIPKLEHILTDSMFEETQSTASVTIDIVNKIKYFEGGTLKDYQVEGLTWLTILFENGVNGILADEMGLGKTIQVIALICHLYEKEVSGPYLIVAPLSTIPNWASEFKRFAPQIPVVTFHGSASERFSLKQTIAKSSFTLNGVKVKPVIITTYQMPLMEKPYLARFHWQYLIIDEGHRIKNHGSQLAIELQRYNTSNRLLLTGTPLQNNLTELWALLHFLLPHVFTDVDTFASLCLVEDIEDNRLVEKEQSTNMISTIHKVLAPFMLRRLKCDVLLDLVPKKETLVYCPMSTLQKDLYTFIIRRNLSKLSGKKEEVADIDIMEPRRKRKCTFFNYCEPPDNVKEDLFMLESFKAEEKAIGSPLKKEQIEYIYHIKMQNTMMMFKKVVDHPYLVHFPLKPNSVVKELLVDEQLVQQSGKMLVLDAMLVHLKKTGHKVLIFSTFVMLLDLIEDYLIMRNYNYRRLDGSNSLQQRDISIREFNTDPSIFIFLLSTRAGGLGINLTGADTVIFYDRDWNPQVDLQAQDRCHRIGQTKPVMVYSLITKNTIDERIIRIGNIKRRLEKIIIKDGKFKSLEEDKTTLEMDLRELQQLIESNDCSNIIHSNGYVFTDKELENLLDRTDLYKLMEAKR